MKRPLPTLETSRIRLRPLAEADLPLTRAWRNQDDVRQWFFDSRLISPDQHRIWFESYEECEDDYVFIIEDKVSGQPVGQIALYHIDPATRRAEFGRLMIGNPRARGQGLAREATELILGAAFDRWGLDEVYLESGADNAAALAVYDACGFLVIERRGNVVKMVRRKREARPCAASAAS